eukprot:3116879-Rhodomonas_salina.2
MTEASSRAEWDVGGGRKRGADRGSSDPCDTPTLSCGKARLLKHRPYLLRNARSESRREKEGGEKHEPPPPDRTCPA